MLCRRIFTTSTHWLLFSQKLLKIAKKKTTEYCQPTDNTDITLDEKTEKKPSKRNYYSKDVYNFLKSKSPQFVDLIPKALMRRATSTTTNLCIINNDSAKALASMISKELLNDSSYVIECNPGLGLLTKELLKAGVPFIHLYEGIKPFYESGGCLSMLTKKYPDKLKLKELNFFKVWKLLLIHQFLESKQIDDYLDDVPYSQWENSSYMQIINLCPTRKIISLIVHNFFNQTHLFERGRPCFYIAAPAPVWHNFSKVDCPSYSQYTVLLNIFFDIKLLGELPREDFIPWPREKYWKLDNLDCPMQIVKLEPRKDAYDILAKDDIKTFWFFSKYCLKTRKNKVLAEFEKLVPGSGVKLVQQDCGILTTFKELPPKKLLEIFKMYKSWPEYDEFMFNPSLSGGEEKKGDEKLEQEEDEAFAEFEPDSVDIDGDALPADVKQQNS